MRSKNYLVIVLIAIIALNILFVLSTYPDSIKKITTRSLGSINLTVEQLCGDTYCNSPETCSSCAADCGACAGAAVSAGGGGGAREVVLPLQIFEISQQVIKLKLKPGDAVTTEFNVKNTGKDPLIINLEVSKINNLISISPQTLFLIKDSSQNVKVSAFINPVVAPGLYAGKIIVTSGSIKKEIEVIIEVVSKRILFDVSLDIPAEYKQILQGQELILNPTIFNLADLSNPEVDVVYLIKDFNGNVILEQSEKISLQNQLTYTKRIKLPTDIPYGRYVAAIYVKYKDSFGISSNIFEIISGKPLPAAVSSNKLIILTSIIFLVLLITLSSLLYYEHLRLLNIEKSTIQTVRKIPSRHIIHTTPQMVPPLISKLEKQLQVLQKSYGEGYVSKESYLKCKNRLAEAMTRLRP